MQSIIVLQTLLARTAEARSHISLFASSQITAGLSLYLFPFIYPPNTQISLETVLEHEEQEGEVKVHQNFIGLYFKASQEHSGSVLTRVLLNVGSRS